MCATPRRSLNCTSKHLHRPTPRPTNFVASTTSNSTPVLPQLSPSHSADTTSRSGTHLRSNGKSQAELTQSGLDPAAGTKNSAAHSLCRLNINHVRSLCHSLSKLNWLSLLFPKLVETLIPQYVEATSGKGIRNKWLRLLLLFLSLLLRLFYLFQDRLGSRVD